MPFLIVLCFRNFSSFLIGYIIYHRIIEWVGLKPTLKITYFDLLATLLSMEPRILLAFWAESTHYWIMLSFTITNMPKSFSSGMPSIHSLPSLYLCLGLSWPMCRTLCLALLNFMRFTSAHHSCLSRHPFPPVCWPRHKACCHHQACWGCTLSYSVLLTKMLNSSSTNTSPWGTLLVTGLHLDIKPLTATPWVQPSSQFLVHVVRPSSIGQFIWSCCIDPD